MSKALLHSNPNPIFANIDACNFTEVVNRRVPGTEDTIMKNGTNSITRNLFIRYPTGGVSTEKPGKKV